jgi:uncharacterized protein
MQTHNRRTLSPDEREHIAETLRAHGVTRASVFGSFARGTQTDQSDLDVLIEPKDGATLLDLARLELALEDLLGCHVDLITYAELRPELREQALREQEALPI